MKKIVIFAILYCIVGLINAQHYKTNDTIRLGEVSVNKNKINYAIGHNKISIDSTLININQSNNLTTVLSNTASVNILQTGVSLATLSVRGVSSNHVAVNFDGINLNSLTLGHSNISDIPMFFFNDVDLTMGSAGAIYGSDAIGGTLNLKSTPNLNSKSEIELRQDFGSFSRYFTGLKAKTGFGNYIFSIAAYNKDHKNDFEVYDNVYDHIKKRYPKVKEENAAIQNKGALLQIFKKGTNSLIFFKGWFEDNFHEIQGTENEVMSNKRHRIIAGYKYNKKSFSIDISPYYVKDYQTYNKNDIIATERFCINSTIKLKTNFGSNIELGGNYKFINPNVHAYKDKKSETESSLFILYKQKITNNIDLSTNFRQQFYSEYKIPLTPSLGINYRVINRDNFNLTLNANYSKGFKIPTLNSRYWGNVGNPDIKPEKSNNYDFGIKSQIKKGNLTSTLSLNAYYLNVNNLIIWITSPTLKPENRDKVKNKGIESSIEFKYNLSDFALIYKGAYNYLKVQQINNNIEYDFIEYSPSQSFTNSLKVQYKKKLYVYLTHNYKGKYYDDIAKSHKLGNISLYDINFGYNLKLIKKYNAKFNFSINNITNNLYEIKKGYGMPGRNYNLGITLKI